MAGVDVYKGQVSRRSEPSSRTALNGEQPYPWDLLQPQMCIRDRGEDVGRMLQVVAVSIETGSYTHLDVYKRQGLCCSPIKLLRELVSERRETVRSLSIAGARLSLIHILFMN